MYARGMNNDQIARQLEITPRTVKAHFDAIRHKLRIERKKDIALALHELGFDVYPK